MTRPEAPAALSRFPALQGRIEQLRAEHFPEWREALEKASGNVSRAGRAFWPELSPENAKTRAWNWTRALGLADYSRALREKVGSNRGRPSSKRGVLDQKNKSSTSPTTLKNIDST